LFWKREFSKQFIIFVHSFNDFFVKHVVSQFTLICLFFNKARGVAAGWTRGHAENRTLHPGPAPRRSLRGRLLTSSVSDPHPILPDLDPGFPIFADADQDPDPECEIFANPDPGLISNRKLVFFLHEKSKKSTLDPDQNADPGLDPDPGTPRNAHPDPETQKSGSNADPDPKPC